MCSAPPSFLLWHLCNRDGLCPLWQGVTFRVESGELVIARILHGGMIDQQGLLHVGDIIKEVNGKEVGNDPKVLQEMLKEASGSVVLKILPSYQEPHTARQVSRAPAPCDCCRRLLVDVFASFTSGQMFFHSTSHRKRV